MDKLKSKIKKYQNKFPSVKNLIIKKSNIKDKRFCAQFELGGKKYTKHFGLKGAFTYFDGAPKSKRDSYRARASKIKNSEGRYTYVLPGTSNSFAYWILW
jgi:hypothetical protein